MVKAPAGASELDAAYGVCLRAARAHYENFPVASVLVPRPMRRHIAALYAFARSADDFADEGDAPAEERLRLLDGWRARLHLAATSNAPGPPPQAGEPSAAAAMFLALGDTIRTRALPLVLFDDLLSAFAQDVTVGSYASWDDLLDYCRRSANPVGRLVLRIAGYDDARLDRWSDALCTALQLTNFWQDRQADLVRHRDYLPAGLPLSDAISRTRALFQAGRPVCDAVHGRLRYELRATWLGGIRILDRVEQSLARDGAGRPALGAADVPGLALRLIRWRAA